MNRNETNYRLKQLMLEYEQGQIGFDEYRHSRTTLIDNYSGVTPFIASSSSFETHGKTAIKKASGRSATVAIVLVIAAALVTFLALNKSEEKNMSETFVDSNATPLVDN